MWYGKSALSNWIRIQEIPCSILDTELMLHEGLIVSVIVRKKYILARAGVTYKVDFGLNDWIYWHLIHTTRNYRQCSAIADLHTLYSSPLHTHLDSQSSLVVSRQRIITVSISLQITHEVFFSQPNSFLVIILQLPIQFNSKLLYRQAGVPNRNSSLSTTLLGRV
jgi:hypothetical protein